MKILAIFLAVSFLCTGCAGEATVETIADDIPVMAAAEPRQIQVELPDNAVAPVLESDSEQLYFSEEYQICVETLSAGDLAATVKTLSGCDREKLTLVQTDQDNVTRYDFVWAAAGEDGDLVGRAAILDDGNYHYCLSVLRPAAGAESQIIWQNVFSSFSLEEENPDSCA